MRTHWLSKAAGAIGGAFGTFRYYASGMSGAISGYIQSYLAGTTVDFKLKAGVVYDNSAAFGGIAWLWRNLSYSRLIVERLAIETGKKKAGYVELPDHELPQLIEDGVYYDHTVLWFGTLLSWKVDGNAYWVKLRAPAGNVVAYVYVPHFQMEPRADKYNPGGQKLISYYRFTSLDGVAIDLSPDDVVHFRHGIDPRNPRRGLAPLASALREIVTDNEAATIGVALLLNGGVAGIGISPKQGATNAGAGGKPPSPDAQERYRDLIVRNATGDNAFTPTLFKFPVDITQLGYKPSEMVLDKQRALAVSRILMSIGIDPMVLGLPSEQKTYSNLGEAKQGAYEDTLIPLMQVFAIQITHQALRKDFAPDARGRTRVGWDTSGVRALEPDQDKLYARLSEGYVAGWIKRKEAKQAAKLDFDETADDVYSTDVLAGAAQQALAKKLGDKARAGRQSYEALQATLGEGDEDGPES